MDADVEAKIEAYIDGEIPESFHLRRRIRSDAPQITAAGRNRYIGYLISLATRSFEG